MAQRGRGAGLTGSAGVDVSWPSKLLDLAGSRHQPGTRRVCGPAPLSISGDASVVEATSERLVAGGRAAWPDLAVSVVEGDIGLVPPVPAPATDGQTVRLFGEHDGVVAYFDGEGLVWLLDEPNARGLRWSPDEETVPVWERAAPLRVLLHWWAARQGGALVHAAAVAGPRGAALLVGPGGAGKSTSALACVGSGLMVLGDDYCLLDGGPPVSVGALYAVAKADEHTLALLPDLADRVVGVGGRNKVLVALDPPEVSQAPVNVVCDVRRALDGVTRLVPSHPGTSLRRLAPSTVAQLPGRSREVLAVVAAGIRRATTYELRVGDPRAVPEILAGVLA